jgi:hypothetical protein
VSEEGGDDDTLFIIRDNNGVACYNGGHLSHTRDLLVWVVAVSWSVYCVGCCCFRFQRIEK